MSRSFSSFISAMAGLPQAFCCLGSTSSLDLFPITAALHALTVGAIGTMTLAVMTRASLGHTGRPLIAGLGRQVIYALVTLAALLRVLSPFAGTQMMHVLWAAGTSWTAAFGLFAILYGKVLTQPRATVSSTYMPVPVRHLIIFLFWFQVFKSCIPQHLSRLHEKKTVRPFSGVLVTKSLFLTAS